MKPKMERKIVAWQQAKDTGEGAGSFEGYGSVFGHIDSYGDRIIPGAYKDTISDFLQRGASLLSHDWNNLPIGTIANAHEDTIGLYVRSDYHSTQAAQDARIVAKERLERGANVGLSIGYMAREWKYVEEDGQDWPVRELIKIDLFELSQVLIPADSYAGMTGVKSGLPFSDEAEALVSSAEAIIERTKAIQSLRAKDGRAFSPTSGESLRTLAAKLVELSETCTVLLAVPTKVSDADQEAKLRQMRMRSLQLQHSLRKVG